MTQVKVECEYCKIEFYKPLGIYNNAIKRKSKHFCSRQCYYSTPKIKQQRSNNEYKCFECNVIFYSKLNERKFCSKSCEFKFREKPYVKCKQCSVSFQKSRTEIEKSLNHFCGHSCAAIYNNTHKEYGTRKSKMEEFINLFLSKRFSNLKIITSNISTIEMELDFYFPDLNLAIELNGIHHYKPIYGEEKLLKIQYNDLKKKKLCFQNNINLCIIQYLDKSSFSEETKKKYSNIFEYIIQNKINNFLYSKNLYQNYIIPTIDLNIINLISEKIRQRGFEPPT